VTARSATVDTEAEGRAAATYVGGLGRYAKEMTEHVAQAARQRRGRETALASATKEKAEAIVAANRQLQDLQSTLQSTRQENARLSAEKDAFAADRASFTASAVRELDEAQQHCRELANVLRAVQRSRSYRVAARLAGWKRMCRQFLLHMPGSVMARK
jgi:chromosome segregation ATPase